MIKVLNTEKILSYKIVPGDCVVHEGSLCLRYLLLGNAILVKISCRDSFLFRIKINSIAWISWLL